MGRARKRPVVIALTAVLLGGGVAIAPTAVANYRRPWNERRDIVAMQHPSLDGAGNNRRNPNWGRAGTPYSRVAPAAYGADGDTPYTGPNTRLVSNRIFNDTHQNLFSENNVTQWGFVWGQFLDHTIGLRDEAGAVANVPFDAADPLESFTNTLGSIPFTRSAAVAGTGAGTGTAREQLNTVNSFINAWAVYGGTKDRLEWLREGPVDGNLNNNSALLLLPDGLLPRRDSRGDAASAPAMATDGRLLAQPAKAAVAGDVRANENIALTATHTLFAREHNRIVSKLPGWLTHEQKFQIARRIVIAEQQYITYTEFLPALGVRLPSYRGYNPRVNTSISNEFATVGYRAHSMIHGEIEAEVDADRYDAATLQALEDQGVEVETSEDGSELELVVPLNVAFFNPDLVGLIGLGPVLQGVGLEPEYRNDEQIDNQLRSVLFQIPAADNPECLDGPGLPECFNGVVDLGAVDIERGRDHGIPRYNDLRRAYGLAPMQSFTDITGEDSEAFPADPELTPGDEINDPDSLDFIALFDREGDPIDLNDEEAVDAEATRGVRRTTLAARLKAIYGSVNEVDAFTGMVSEAHVRGTEFGELQLAIWRKQFQALRDGDRFFYQNDPGLSLIKRRLGIDYRRTLGEIIALNTDIPRSDLADNVFVLEPEPSADPAPAAPGAEAAEPPGGRGTGAVTPTPAAVGPSGSATTNGRRHRHRRLPSRLRRR